MIKYFKDISIGELFSFKNSIYKKIDILTAKHIGTKQFRDFYLMDKVEVIIEPKFKLNS